MTLDVQPAVRICQRERAESGAASLLRGVPPLGKPLINTPAPAASPVASLVFCKDTRSCVVLKRSIPFLCGEAVVGN